MCISVFDEPRRPWAIPCVTPGERSSGRQTAAVEAKCRPTDDVLTCVEECSCPSWTCLALLRSDAEVTRSSFRSTTSRCNPQNPREPTFVPGAVRTDLSNGCRSTCSTGSGWFIASTILDNPGPGPDITRPIDFRPFTGVPFFWSRHRRETDWESIENKQNGQMNTLTQIDIYIYNYINVYIYGLFICIYTYMNIYDDRGWPRRPPF